MNKKNCSEANKTSSEEISVLTAFALDQKSMEADTFLMFEKIMDIMLPLYKQIGQIVRNLSPFLIFHSSNFPFWSGFGGSL
jgi:hypothetical protein